MVDPKVVLWMSMKGVVYSFSANRENGIKEGIAFTVIPLLNIVKNSLKFAKVFVELLALWQ